MILVQNEMRWVENWFAYKEKWWVARAEDSNEQKKRGHAIYAWKQVALWHDFGRKAHSAFKSMKV
jgi:hypothetical protein